MKKSQIAFACAVIILGAAVVGYSFFHVWQEWADISILQIAVLIVLCAICRSLPVNLSESQSIDMAFIVILASALYYDPLTAIVIYTVSSFFVFERLDSGELKHIFTKPPIKILFNQANVAISIFAAGFAMTLTNSCGAGFSVPLSIFTAVLFTLADIIINLMILLLLLSFGTGENMLKLKNLLGALPNVIATAPLGIFFAFILRMDNGFYLLFLFMLPLLLARYSFKLYRDNVTQYYNMTKALTAAIEARDPYTEGHSKRVEIYSTYIAQSLQLTPGVIEDIKIASLLHDIGKIGIDDSILNKRGPLIDEEWELVRQHPRTGFKIVQSIHLRDRVNYMILHHHERFDGKGYPDGIPGEKLSLEASIIALADAFDAMTSDRPYRVGMNREKAYNIIREESGKQFNPKVVDAFFEICKDIPDPKELDGK